MQLFASEELTKLLPALIEAKKGFSPVLKDSTNPHFHASYASLRAVLEAVEKPLLDNGLALVQPTVAHEDGSQVCLTYLMHVSGEWIGSSYRLNPVKTDPQGFGSALTYARRYQALAVLGLAPEDDDGNEASRRDIGGSASGSERTEAPPRDFATEAKAATSLDTLRDIQRAAAAAGEWVADSAVVAAVLARKETLEAAATERQEAQ